MCFERLYFVSRSKFVLWSNSLSFSFSGPEMNGAMRRMGEVIHNAPTETRVKVLAVVSSLLTLQVGLDQYMISFQH